MESRVNVIENEFIAMTDGVKLAAKIWLPASAKNQPVPALLDINPYGKRYGTAQRDQQMYPYFAAHGYACVRLDIRGSGESLGILRDEYLTQEQEDCLEVLTWMATQSWCNGNLGMIGKSWGGFAALQVAARRHPNLKCIISVCSTDMRFFDDIHYMGGCLLTDNFQWSAMMMGIQTQPPDKSLLGDHSREVWLNRLKQQPLLAKRWLAHQTNDAYWKHGSIAEDWSSIQCAVYLISGWLDGYANTVPRILENLKAPRKGLIGPWAHCYPHIARPGPEIGFLQEALRWWDYWLKGIDNGIMNEPMYRAWMQDKMSPTPEYHDQPGRWVAEKTLPSDTIKLKSLYLTANGKLSSTPSTSEHCVSGVSPQSVGETAGVWCGYGSGPEKPSDQRIDDARSICFESEPLSETMEFLGRPVIRLNVMVDTTDAFLAVRLNEVTPDGASTRISYGLLNLAHREGFEKKVPITPGEFMQVVVPLKNMAHTFKPGNKIRLAISTTYWPLVWPSPEVTKLTILPSHSQLLLPIRKPQPLDEKLPAFKEKFTLPPLPVITHRNASGTRRVEHDIGKNTTTTIATEDDGEYTYLDESHDQLRAGFKVVETYAINNDDPLSATEKIETYLNVSRRDWQVRTESRAVMTADKNHYYLQATLSAYENDELVFNHEWQEKIERSRALVLDATKPTSHEVTLFKSPAINQAGNQVATKTCKH